jgi:hypothetical protein
MQHKTIRRGLVAVATILGLLALSAAPASADQPTSIEGIIYVGGAEFEVGGEDPNPCGSIDIDITFDPVTGNWVVTGTMKAPFTVTNDPTQTKYQADITFLAGSVGTATLVDPGPPPEYVLGGTLNVQIQIRLLDKDGPDNEDDGGINPETGLPFDDDCAKGAVICTIRTRLIIDPAQSAHVGTLGPPPTGQTFLLGSTELTGGIRPVVVSGTCPVTIQGAIVGQPVIADLVLNW